jgi:glutamate-1-semialdehyde 2,1-aminomutase
LIFDEVVTGFRSPLAARSSITASRPTSPHWAKSLGGGHPIRRAGRAQGSDGVLLPGARRGGRGVLRRHLQRQSSLLRRRCGFVARAAAAGIVERLHAISQAVGDGLREISRRVGRPTFVMNSGPTVDLWFTDRAIESYPDTFAADRNLARRWKLGLVERGIWSPPGFKMFFSLAHTDHDVGMILSAAEESMRAL